MATVTEKTPAVRSRRAKDSVHRLTGVQILATGACAPAEVVRNEDLAELGYDGDWIIQRTGIRERRRAPAALAASDLAWEAARQCLEQAGVAGREVDLLLVATVTPDRPMPSTACYLQRRLHARGPAMDLNAACAGFIYALVTAAQFIRNGCSRRALVIGADLMSRVVNPADKKTFPLFGDGAGAVLLGAGREDQGLLAYTLGADGEGADLLYVPAGGTREPVSAETLAEQRQFLQMDGRGVFKWAVRIVADSARSVLHHAGLSVDGLDLVALHQANIRILDAVIEDLRLDRRQVLVNLDRYGNTSAASIPLVLAEAQSQGRLAPGAVVLMSGFGAGLTWGTAVFRC